MKTCDLHTHSIYSDGTCTPTELVLLARAAGLSAVALCDHNTVDGIPEFMSVSEKYGIEAVAGAEFSVDYNGKELHLLGLYLPLDSLDIINVLMEEANLLKEKSNVELIASLKEAGIAVDFEELKNSTPKGKFNRAHVAAYLTEKGYTSSIDEAFKTVLSPAAGYYKKPKRTDVFEMIDFVRNVGAVPVLAHPFLNLTYEQLVSFLPLAKECGLCGMECLYSEYDEVTARLSFELADRFGLLYSGGSDFHGENKPSIKIGIGKGSLRIPYEFALELKTKKQS